MMRYAVLGNPINHSLSPRIHAQFAKQTRQEMIYEAIQVFEGDFPFILKNFLQQAGQGVNVTIPYKEDAYKCVTQHTMLASQAKAVNTVRLEKDGTMTGENTDGTGLVRDLSEYYGHSLENKMILLLGGGGAVRGVLPALLNKHPRYIIIANRTRDKAVTIATDFDKENIGACGFDDLNNVHPDFIINGTAASLSGEILPIPSSLLKHHPVCYDMMYGEKAKPFLNWAQSNGAAVCYSGIGMLVEQAAESFYFWRNVKPDTAEVRRVLSDLLYKG